MQVSTYCLLILSLDERVDGYYYFPSHLCSMSYNPSHGRYNIDRSTAPSALLVVIGGTISE